MDELLQKLLEAEILSADTKKELEEAFNKKFEEALEEAKKEVEAETKLTLSEQWVDERDLTIDAIDSKVNQFLESELVELKEDISRFRDLEAEYAEKLVEAKGELAVELKENISELVEKVGNFLEIRIAGEMEDLHEDIEIQRKNQFGKKMFDAMVNEYRDNFSQDDDISGTLVETETELSETKSKLEETETKFAILEREIKLNKVLIPLSGRQRDIMEAILKNVSTSQLEEGYNTFIGRVVKDSEETITEMKDDDKKDDDKKDDDKKDDDYDKDMKKDDDKSCDKDDDKKDDDYDKDMKKDDDKKDVKESTPALTESALENLKKLAGI